MFFMVFQVKVQPYDASIHNNLELGSLMVSQLTLFLGLITNFVTTNERGSSRTMTEEDLNNTLLFISYAIILINIAFLGYFAVAFGYHLYYVLPRPFQKLFDCLCCICQRHLSKTVGRKLLSTMNHEIHEEDAIKNRYVQRRNSASKHFIKMVEGANASYHNEHSSDVKTHMKVVLPSGVQPGSILRVKSPWDANIRVNVRVPYNAKGGMEMLVELPKIQREVQPPAPQAPATSLSADSDTDDDCDDHVVI